jgi:RNA polymerase sigma-70 factor (ECF subfamily)
MRFAYRYVRDEAIAENIIHDVFLYLWNERERLDFAVNIKTYLFNAVKNRSLKYLRRKEIENNYKTMHIIVKKEIRNPENILLNKELEDAIQDALNRMPEKRREIFAMNRFDQLSYSEIASILNISVKTVETQISRSLKFLRKTLSSYITFLL